MGIPSVKTIDIDFTRTYQNINSANLFIPGNKRIATIKDIQKINKNTDKYIHLARDTTSGIYNKIINSTGEYTYTSADIKTATDSYYYTAYYDEEIGIEQEGGSNLTIQENVISLKKSVNVNNILAVDHFFDKNSYNNTGGSGISRKFTYTDVYEITDSTELAKLNTDVGDIGVTQYTDANTNSKHQTIPKDWTLLYLSLSVLHI